MGLGVFDSGQQTTNHVPPLALPCHTLATIIDDPSNPNPRGVSSNLSVIETWGLIYIIHTDKQPL